MKSLFRFFVLILALFLGGCDPIGEVWAWFSSLLDSFFSDIACYLYGFFISVFQLVVDLFCSIVTPLLIILPQYELPVIDLTSVTFLQYVAYFFPIVEIATILQYLLLFYTSFWVVRVLLRWLKIVR